MKDNPQKIYYYIYHTQYGYLGLSASQKGLKAIVLPQKNKSSVKKKLFSLCNGNRGDFIKDQKRLNYYYKQIISYLKGKLKKFNVNLDIKGYSDFCQLVWKATKRIPYGKTRSYKWIAEKICSNVTRASARKDSPQRSRTKSRKKIPSRYLSRAVGNALGKNPVPIIIPCHRVIKTDGTLGGFSGGLRWKKFLLNLEKQNIKKFGRVR